MAMGQDFVNLYCDRFSPTNALKKYHRGLRQVPNRMLAEMKIPVSDDSFNSFCLSVFTPQ